MIYPEFLQNGSTIGIAAPSAGVGDDIDDWEKSIGVLEREGFQILRLRQSGIMMKEAQML